MNKEVNRLSKGQQVKYVTSQFETLRRLATDYIAKSKQEIALLRADHDRLNWLLNHSAYTSREDIDAAMAEAEA